MAVDRVRIRSGSNGSFRQAWILLVVRLGGLLVLTALVWLLLRAIFAVDAFPPNNMWAIVILFPVNLLCLGLVRRYYRAEGTTLREALGIRPGRVGRDILWGLLWLVVLNVPFSFAIAGTVFAMYGAEAPAAFETIFVNEASFVPLHPVLQLIIALFGVIPFMVLNASTEELVFRGYARTAIESRWGVVAGIVVSSVLFGVQHVLFAASVPGMLVYFVAFTLWGALAAVIVRRQGRLFPVVIAHYLINISLSAPAVVFSVLGLVG